MKTGLLSLLYSLNLIPCQHLIEFINVTGANQKFVENHQMLHLRYEHVTVCKFTFKRKKKESKQHLHSNDMHTVVFRKKYIPMAATYFEMNQKIRWIRWMGRKIDG